MRFVGIAATSVAALNREPAGIRLLSCTALLHRRHDLLEEHRVDFLAERLTAVMMTTAMLPATSAYSIAVAPRTSPNNRRMPNSFFRSNRAASE